MHVSCLADARHTPVDRALARGQHPRVLKMHKAEAAPESGSREADIGAEPEVHARDDASRGLTPEASARGCGSIQSPQTALEGAIRASETRALEELVLARLREYAASLQGHDARDMYGLIMPQLERPLIRVALELAGGCQSHAATMLGIHRNTLRTRLRALGLDVQGDIRKLRSKNARGPR